jgi:mannose-1-phosphate guanylyltransferase
MPAFLSGRSILKGLKEHAEDIYNLFHNGNEVYNTSDEQSFINEHYPNSPNISIDYAIMEQADNVYTIPADFGWSDLGTWASLYESAPRNEDNNVLSAKQLNIKDTQNSIIHINNDKLAIIRGLDNFIVVDEGNALLIYPKDKEQEIKEVVKEMSITFGETFI